MSADSEELRCPICLELFDDPRILPCGHTFCFRCLQGHFHLQSLIPKTAVSSSPKGPSPTTAVSASALTCPMCCAAISAATDPSALPRNIAACNMVSTAKSPGGAAASANAYGRAGSNAESESSKPCTNCGEAPATLSCAECSATLCAACSKSVHAMRMFSSHKVSPIETARRVPGQAAKPPSAKCRIHQAQDLSLYCKQDECLACSHCLLLGPHTSGGVPHQCISADDAESQRRAICGQQLDRVNNWCSKANLISTGCGDAAAQLKAEVSEVEAALNNNFEEVICAVEKRRQELISALHADHRRRESELELLKERAFTVSKSAQEVKDVLEKLSKFGQIPFLSNYHTVSGRANALLSIPPPEFPTKCGIQYQPVDNSFLSQVAQMGQLIGGLQPPSSEHSTIDADWSSLHQFEAGMDCRCHIPVTITVCDKTSTPVALPSTSTLDLTASLSSRGCVVPSTIVTNVASGKFDVEVAGVFPKPGPYTMTLSASGCINTAISHDFTVTIPLAELDFQLLRYTGDWSLGTFDNCWGGVRVSSLGQINTILHQRTPLSRERAPKSSGKPTSLFAYPNERDQSFVITLGRMRTVAAIGFSCSRWLNPATITFTFDDGTYSGPHGKPPAITDLFDTQKNRFTLTRPTQTTSISISASGGAQVCLHSLVIWGS
ncbi:midline 1 [Pelomyxa schiedti]|nr:midline 1 [Pelomyxa schiedti]